MLTRLLVARLGALLLLIGGLSHSAFAQESSEDAPVVEARYDVGPPPDTARAGQVVVLDGATLRQPRPNASARSASGITVTAPNGGETWAIGERVEISWTQTERADVFIYLVRGNGQIVRGIYRVNNTRGGTTEWTLPPYLEPGEDYRIQVFRVDDASVLDESDAPFRIVPGVGPYITVLDPFAGVTWEVGDVVPIRWTSERMSQDVRIRLLYGPTLVAKEITTRTSDDGEYLWTVPDDLEPRDDYYVSVRGTNDQSIFDTTRDFVIKFPGTEPLGQVDIPGDGWDVEVRGDIAYVANDRNGFRTVDVANPTAPFLLDVWDTSNSVRDVALIDDLAYTAINGFGLGVFGIADPGALTLLGSARDRDVAYGVAAYGPYALLADDDVGLTIYDASDPANVTEVGSWDDGQVSDCRGVEVVAARAYLTCREGGLVILSLATPEAPAFVGSVETPDGAWDVAIQDNLAFVADEDSGVQIVDISNPLAPVIVGVANTPDEAWDVAVEGDLLYVATDRDGLQIYDISTPSAPERVGFYYTPGLVYAVDVVDGTAYVIDRDYGLFIVGTALGDVDISPPAPPTGLTAASEDGGVRLSWDPNLESDLAGYRLYRAVDGSGFVAHEQLERGETELLDTRVENGRSYGYYLTALDFAENESGPSEAVGGTPALCVNAGVIVEGVSVRAEATPGDPDVAVVSWTPTGGAAASCSYRVYRREEGGPTFTFDVGPSSSSYNDASAVPARRYHYSVTSRSVAGVESDASDEAYLGPTPGTTVITHGLNFPPFILEDNGLSQDQSWTVSMAEAMLERLEAGRIWIVCGDAGGTDRPCYPDGEDLGSGVVLYYKEKGTPPEAAVGEQIIVFDWLRESEISLDGFAEGASNALTAILLEGARKSYWQLEQLHFIGHSRGSVVLSEVIQRLGVLQAQDLLPSEIVVDDAIHFTPLDPHPWDNATWDRIGDTPLTARDHEVNKAMRINIDLTEAGGDLINDTRRFGVICWSSVGTCDNHWQNKGGTELNGLADLPGSDYNLWLRSRGQDGDIGAIGHKEVHAWYHGTIILRDTDGDGSFDDGDGDDPTEIDSNWYNPEFTVAREEGGFNRSRSLGGPLSMTEIKTVPERPNVESDASYMPGAFWNGEFNLRGTSGGGDATPGWAYQGGSADTHSEEINGYNRAMNLGLYAVIFEGEKEAKSNWMYVPRGVNHLEFTLAVPIPSNTTELRVYAEDLAGSRTDLSSYRLSTLSAPHTQPILLPEGFSAATYRFGFQIETVGPIDTQVLVDDIAFTRVVRSTGVLAVATPSSGQGRMASDLPARLVATDLQGHTTEVLTDSTWALGIPGSRVYLDVASDSSFVQRIVLPYSDDPNAYRFEAIADAPTEVSLYVEEYGLDERPGTVGFTGVKLAEGGTVKATAEGNTPTAEAEIDADGDGTAETTRVADRVLINQRVAVTSEGSGQVQPSGDVAVLYGSAPTFTFVPDDGATVTDVLVDGVSVGAVTSYTFEDVREDHTIAVTFSTSTSGEDETTALPQSLTLEQNHPNPFNPSTTLRYGLPSADDVQVDVYDMLGRRVATLVDGPQAAGWHEVRFEAGRLASGVYVYRLTVSDETLQRKMLLLK